MCFGIRLHISAAVDSPSGTRRPNVTRSIRTACALGKAAGPRLAEWLRQHAASGLSLPFYAARCKLWRTFVANLPNSAVPRVCVWVREAVAQTASSTVYGDRPPEHAFEMPGTKYFQFLCSLAPITRFRPPSKASTAAAAAASLLLTSYSLPYLKLRGFESERLPIVLVQYSFPLTASD